MRKQFSSLVECDFTRGYDEVIEGLRSAAAKNKKVALMVSPMLTCEEAYTWAKLVKQIAPNAVFALGPVPTHGTDKIYPTGADEKHPKAFHIRAEKAPNARGVRRVLKQFGGSIEYADLLRALGHGTGTSDIGAVVVMGNYPSEWATAELRNSLSGKFVVVVDTLSSAILDVADVVLPGATFAEKAGTFENWQSKLQAFEQAIGVIEMAKSEGQMALDMLAILAGKAAPQQERSTVVVQSTLGQVAGGAQVTLPYAELFNAANIRSEMAKAGLSEFATQVSVPAGTDVREPDMEMVTL
jgi:NADH-quinone oxidoreductase subunit G